MKKAIEMIVDIIIKIFLHPAVFFFLVFLPGAKVFFWIATIKYYTVHNYIRNQWIMTCILLIGASIFFFLQIFSWTHSLDQFTHVPDLQGKRNFNYILIAPRVGNLVAAWMSTPKKFQTSIYGYKFNASICDWLEKNIVKELWWERAQILLNLYSEGKMSINDNEMVPLVYVQRFGDNIYHEFFWEGMNICLSSNKKIKKHPAFPEFKRQVKTMEVSDILLRMGIDVHKKES